jgi:hypothetical protein
VDDDRDAGNRAIAKVSAFEKDGEVRVPGVARCIVGTKQDTTRG